MRSLILLAALVLPGCSAFSWEKVGTYDREVEVVSYNKPSDYHLTLQDVKSGRKMEPIEMECDVEDAADDGKLRIGDTFVTPVSYYAWTGDGAIQMEAEYKPLKDRFCGGVW